MKTSILKANFPLKINISKKTRIPLGNDKIIKIAEITLRFEKIRSAEINILFASDSFIRKLNFKFRNKNRLTDVLSFGAFLKVPKEKPAGFIGDIAISAQRAKKIGAIYGNSYKKELTLYIIHGILHLIGYDDEEPCNKKIMLKHQEIIFKKICETEIL